MKNIFIAAILIAILCSKFSYSEQVIKISPHEGDMTMTVRHALEKITEKEVKIEFVKGTYFFKPDYAVERFCHITNHGNGNKKVIFPIEELSAVEIEGNGSEFIFHGLTAPFQFRNCQSISVNNLVIDWDIPFTFLCEVIEVNKKEGWRDVKPFTDGFSWKLEKSQIKFPNVDGFNYEYLGSTLPFEPEHKRVCHGAWDQHSRPEKVEKRKNGILRIYEKMKHYPPVGALLSSKGDRAHDRYAPAFQVTASKNIRFNRVTVHHALGMGFLFERSEDITIANSGVHLREGSNRVISSTADATHFANCKGDILIENCQIENMLDDGTNVHGTYVEVDKVVDAHTVRVALKHFEQMGFIFAEKGDEVWFIHQPDPSRASVNMIEAVKVINDKYSELTFREKLPDKLKSGDVLENKTWNPNFTMRGCNIRDHRARNIVLKTPLKIVIEDNDFSSMMSSILFRGETYFWFESGAVSDVLIQNNQFKYCAYSGSPHAVMYVTPRLGKSFDSTIAYDRNIRFINNTIENFDNRVIWADRVDGLTIRGNKIIKVKGPKQLYPDAPLFQFDNCKNVEVIGNTYEGDCKNAVKADEVSRATLKVKKNKGFNH